VIHRFGTLLPGEPIVLVLAAARHRRASLDGVGFLIDWLKTAAPFWKKEHLPDGATVWVDARCEDAEATSAWGA
jgi:molybdopterin synthase catalytic subunit